MHSPTRSREEKNNAPQFSTEEEEGYERAKTPNAASIVLRLGQRLTAEVHWLRRKLSLRAVSMRWDDELPTLPPTLLYVREGFWRRPEGERKRGICGQQIYCHACSRVPNETYDFCAVLSLRENTCM